MIVSGCFGILYSEVTFVRRGCRIHLLFGPALYDFA